MLTSLELSPTQRDFLNKACQVYQSQVDEQAVRYIVARGLDKAAATGLRLGLVGDPLPGHERFRGMLSIPYVTPAGVVGIKFRCMSEHDCKAERHPKYDQPDGQQQRLYNVAALHGASDVVGIAEGEMSAAVLTHMVGIPTVGVAGTGGWLEHYPRVFADFERVLVFADNDSDKEGNPGLRFAKKIVKSIGAAAHVIVPPDTFDPDDWFRAEGADVIREKCGL